MTKKLRISHILVQPVIVWDDGEELSPGPATQPTQVKPSELATLLPHIIVQMAQAEAELLAQEEADEESPHIIASGEDWTREQALHAIACPECASWYRQASEWLERHPENNEPAPEVVRSCDETHPMCETFHPEGHPHLTKASPLHPDMQPCKATQDVTLPDSGKATP